jgi:hypothetical protein
LRRNRSTVRLQVIERIGGTAAGEYASPAAFNMYRVGSAPQKQSGSAGVGDHPSCVDIYRGYPNLPMLLKCFTAEVKMSIVLEMLHIPHSKNDKSDAVSDATGQIASHISRRKWDQ